MLTVVLLSGTGSVRFESTGIPLLGITLPVKQLLTEKAKRNFVVSEDAKDKERKTKGEKT